jgi:hypothetical protein
MLSVLVFHPNFQPFAYYTPAALAVVNYCFPDSHFCFTLSARINNQQRHESGIGHAVFRGLSLRIDHVFDRL